MPKELSLIRASIFYSSVPPPLLFAAIAMPPS